MWIAEGIHRTDGGFLVPQRAVVPPLRGLEGVLHIGLAATIQGPLRHMGAIVIAAEASAEQVVAGHELIVGARAETGDLYCDGRIVVQAGAHTGHIRAGGDVLLLGASTVGDIDAGGDIIVVGDPKTGALRPGGRVSTRPW